MMKNFYFIWHMEAVDSSDKSSLRAQVGQRSDGTDMTNHWREALDNSVGKLVYKGKQQWLQLDKRKQNDKDGGESEFIGNVNDAVEMGRLRMQEKSGEIKGVSG